jgi:hypothetical protein
MWIPFRVLFGKKAGYFFSFKDRAMEASSQDVHEVYMATADVHLRRETDLNEKCVAAIKANIAGTTVLDVGCGRGYLADQLSRAGLRRHCLRYQNPGRGAGTLSSNPI